MNKYLFLLLFSSVLYAKEPLKVAVIDSGLDITDVRFTSHLCKNGHKNYTDQPMDDLFFGHGTHVTGLIIKYAEDANYCIIIYKYLDIDADDYKNQKNYLDALQAAVDSGAKIVNLSVGGPTYSKKEEQIMKNHPEVTFVVAAGNDGKNLDIPGNEYYPASHWLPNEVVVANIRDNGVLALSSNYGKRTVNENGYNVISSVPYTMAVLGGGRGIMTGTSMSAAIRTGKLIRKLAGEE